MNKLDVFNNVLERHKDSETPHLDDMSISDLCNYRLDVSQQIKQLENEKKSIDEHLLFHLTSIELDKGIKVNAEHILKLRRKTTWKYSNELKEHISLMRKYEQDTGEAFSEVTEYLCFTRT